MAQSDYVTQGNPGDFLDECQGEIVHEAIAQNSVLSQHFPITGKHEIT